MKKEEMQRYSLWYRINKIISGPFYKVSGLYVILYIVLMVSTLIINPSKVILNYYLIGFPVFLITGYIFFTGLLLRSLGE